MHTASYEFLMKPKESAGCHQTLSARVGSGDETKWTVGSSVPMTSLLPVFVHCKAIKNWSRERPGNETRGVFCALPFPIQFSIPLAWE